MEKSKARPFRCHAEAFPKAKYYWHFEEGNYTKSGSELAFRHDIRRDQVNMKALKPTGRNEGCKVV